MQAKKISGAAVAVALALGAALSGCGSDDEPRADPPPSAEGATSATAGSDPSSPSTTPSTTATESTSPAVAPATGRLVTIGAISMRVPDGWRYNDNQGINPFTVGATGGVGSQAAFISSTPDLSGGYATLNGTVRNLIKSAYPDRVPKRLPNRRIDGVVFARLKGAINATFEVEHYIAVYEGNTVEIDFSLVRDDGEAVNTAIIEGCLATVEID